MYEHTIKDMFYPGLPTGDLDESTLAPEALAILAAAVAKGVYTLVVTESEGGHDESTEYQAEKAEDDHERTEDQATGGGSQAVQW